MTHKEYIQKGTVLELAELFHDVLQPKGDMSLEEVLAWLEEEIFCNVNYHHGY